MTMVTGKKMPKTAYTGRLSCVCHSVKQTICNI